MTQHEKLFARILGGQADADIRFDDLCGILTTLGFTMRVKGDHHIFFKDGIDEILNLQPRRSKSKSYQVKQVRNVILRYRLRIPNEK